MADIQQFKGFELPTAHDVPIWRYMSLEKFEALLQSQSLYFAAATQFDDHFEGAISKMDHRERLARTAAISPDLVKYDPGVSSAFKQLRRLTKINCWHMNEHESDAMWRLYTATGQGIAIRSTIRRLTESLSDYYAENAKLPETIWLGAVRYVDYNTAKIPNDLMLGRFFCKRLSFAHERELRAAVSLSRAEEFGVRVPENGIQVRVSLGSLVEAVFVAPKAPQSVLDTVRNVLVANGLKVPVRQSALDDPALY